MARWGFNKFIPRKGARDRHRVGAFKRARGRTLHASNPASLLDLKRRTPPTMPEDDLQLSERILTPYAYAAPFHEATFALMNLLLNPGFEDAFPSHWGFTTLGNRSGRTTDRPRSGVAGAFATSVSNNPPGKITQAVMTTVGATYLLSAWALWSNGPGVAFLNAGPSPAGETGVALLNSSDSDGNYVQMSGTYVATSTMTFFVLTVEGFIGPHILPTLWYFDDAEMTLQL